VETESNDNSDIDTGVDPRRERAKARDTLTRLLAMRDHSRLELRQKLSRRYTPETVEHALQEAQDLGLLVPEEELAKRVAEGLKRKGKGRLWIARELKRRGLPNAPPSEAEDFSHMRRTLERKFGNWNQGDRLLRAKVWRFLKGRGFDERGLRALMQPGEDEL
jgi:regulatory protein